MRKFTNIQNELRLEEFANGSLGTLYCVPAPNAPSVMVRHFGSDLPVILVKPFADFVKAAGQWIESRPKLAHLVKIEQPIEVGYDFIARPHHTYYTSTDAYVDWEYPPEPPEQLEQMRTIFREEIGKSEGPKNVLIETVLTRSLLEPNSKTYFAESKEQFIVVEPKLIPSDIEK